MAAVNAAGPGEVSQSSLPHTPEKVVGELTGVRKMLFIVNCEYLISFIVFLNQESAKPVIVRPLENVSVLINGPVELTCDFRLGEPNAAITWSVDNLIAGLYFFVDSLSLPYILFLG